MRIFVALALAAGLTGCATVAPVERPAQMKSQVHFYDMRDADDRPSELTIRFDDGSGERVVRNSDLRAREWGFPTSERYATRSSGTLRVTVHLLKNGRTAQGTIELPLTPDWSHNIPIHVGTGNPLDGCMGCIGVRSFPLSGTNPANPEKLSIVWGGSPISKPTIS
jgi:hypothetical protein